MDENKETFVSETENENAVNSDTDTVTDSEKEVTEATENASDVAADSTQNATEAFVQPVEFQADAAPVKKKVLQLPIIISIACVVLVALGFLVFKCFFDTSVVGTWVVENTATGDEAATQDEADLNYYTFESDGTASITRGTMKMVGTYSLSQTDGKNVIAINITNVLESSYEYEVSGNWFSGRTLTLTLSEYNTSFTLKSRTMKTPELKVPEDFKADDKMTGRWTDMSDYNDGNSYGIVYDFKKDGTVAIEEAGMLYVDGVYTFDDSTITVTYYAGSEETMTLDYAFDGDVLIINGMGYTKDSAASADESSK